MSLGERGSLSVARYLRPEEAVVPFRARPELDELLRWCTSAGHTAIRLVSGDGGAGKTRLALRLGEELEANGWRPLWVQRCSERDAVEAVHTTGQPCVLMVDYAETRTELVGLLDDMTADQDGPDLRVLLFARSPGEWWQQLLASVEEQTGALLEAYSPVMLGPVRAAGGMQEVFDDAVTAFAQEVGTGRPDVRLVLSDPDPVVLVVHAAALLAVVDYLSGIRPQDQVVSGLEVLDALLRHEARYWARSAAGRGLDLDVSVLRIAVAVGCLIGADSETAASVLLARVPDLDSAERRGRVARWLHDLYPSGPEDYAQEQDWLGQLRPDRLAEQLIVGELARRPELIARLFTGLSEARAARALTVLARAALMQDRAVDLLRSAIATDLDHLAIPALLVAVETNPVMGELLSQVIGGQPVSRATLRRIAEASPYPSFALAAPAALVFQRLADDSVNHSERARWLVDLSNRLGDLGRREEALAAIDKAVRIRRRLVQDQPDVFLKDMFLNDLAATLNNVSARQANLGRREEALAMAEEAVTIRSQLARDRPDAFLPDLAASLLNRSIRLGDLGRREEALAMAEEALVVYRKLAEDGAEMVLPSLAASLDNLSNRLASLGRREEARATAEEAVIGYRQLARDLPAAFLPDLARSLNNLSIRFSELGRREEALAAIEEAITIRRPLAQDLPAAFLPDLAASLNNQSASLTELERWEEALAAIEEAINIYRKLSQDSPGAFLPYLATSLHNFARMLSLVNRHAEASAIREEVNAAISALAQIPAGRTNDKANMPPSDP